MAVIRYLSHYLFPLNSPFKRNNLFLDLVLDPSEAVVANHKENKKYNNISYLFLFLLQKNCLNKLRGASLKRPQLFCFADLTLLKYRY